jgi:hypothetical protein
VSGDEFGDEFRDRIAAVIEFWGGAEMVPNRDMADAILAMPEMQEVREFISRMANGPSPKMDGGRRQMEIWNLSETVIDWALGGPW